MLTKLLRRLVFTLRVCRLRLVGYVRGGWYHLVRRPLGYLAWTLWTRCGWVPDRILSRRNAIARLPDLTLLRAPPALIDRYVREEDVQRRLFIWSGDWDRHAAPLEENPRYRLMLDIWTHRHRLETSATMDYLLQRIREGRPGK
ncbi:hypothetical protein [Kineobactrum salinum]|uniref:Uncharacterized protein n=1 Tax=Kineobactrum salinum TaxID=2708301 RepID=A0A6C0U626_9GAMM|nr:hypothetical protein [Kineobactrum salinum]QIB66387.1 hypothetical protein G3T16_14260 [Kineobactrum salinum]